MIRENVVNVRADLINLARMKNPTRNSFFAACSIVCACLGASSAFAQPLEFSELSLLVRARESENAIVQEVQQRKLVRALTPQQEATLRTHGAGESLIQAVRAPAVVLAAADAAAFETRRDQSRQAPPTGTRRPTTAAADQGSDESDLEVFEISVGHPVNLSRWGGPDYEFAFQPPTRLDEGRADALLVDNVRTFTHTATYLGEGRADDSTSVFSRSNYVSVMDHTFTRGLRIDRKNPVWMKGVPYTLYPVYAAGGVSLYYIGSTSDTVKLAVSTGGR